jgi:alpha-glucosidase
VLNGETLKGYIDFCAKYRIPYVSLDGYEFDKAWYGGRVLPFDPKTQDITRPVPEINLPDVLKYAREKGVRVRAWMHGEGLTEENMERVFSIYANWGISGVMVDFMGDDTQKGVERIEEILRRALEHRLTVSFHGIAKPTGLQRTYPNLLTEESVMGQEYNKWPGPNSTPDHEVYVGIIRGAVGPMDTHQGSFRPVPQSQFVARTLQPNSMGTLAHQIATYVVYENELPMLADYPEAYERHADVFRFVLQVPSTWDETRVLMADLDRQLLTVARRSGNDWFVGSLSGTRGGKYSVPLSFLGGKEWQAEAYGDTSDSASDGESIARTVFKVRPGDALPIELSAGGGQLIRLQKR